MSAAETQKRNRVLGLVTLAIVLVLCLTAQLTPSSSAGFTAKVTNSVNTAASNSYFTCNAAVLANKPYLYYKFNDNGSPVIDSSGNGRHGTTYKSKFGDIGEVLNDGSCSRERTGKYLQLLAYGSSGWDWGLISSPPVTPPNTFTIEIWFKTTTTSGGRIFGLSRSPEGTSAVDRHIYMDNQGRVLFGVYPGQYKWIYTFNSFNDGGWHMATASLSSAGMCLYVDAVRATCVPEITRGDNSFSTGYWRVGVDTVTDWGGPSGGPSSHYFAGFIDEAAVYTTALTPEQIKAHYIAGR